MFFGERLRNYFRLNQPVEDRFLDGQRVYTESPLPCFYDRTGKTPAFITGTVVGRTNYYRNGYNVVPDQQPMYASIRWTQPDQVPVVVMIEDEMGLLYDLPKLPESGKANNKVIE